MEHEELAVRGIPTSRRQFAGWLGGAGLLALVGCGGGGGEESESGTVSPPRPVATPAPVITLQPQSQSVTAGAAVTLRVDAAGENVAYQWRRNGEALAGATAAGLALTAQLQDSGARYSVVVSNAGGSVESEAAMLTVTPVSTAGLSLIAGGLGGAGYLEARGTLARLTEPDNLAMGSGGAVYFSSRVRVGKISPEGDVHYIPAAFPYISIGALACNSQGTLFAFATGVAVIYKLVESGTPQFVPFAGMYEPYPGGGFQDGNGVAARLRLPRAPVFDRDDNLYFIDSANHAIRKVSPAGDVTTVAGQPANTTMLDGQGAAAGFEQPTGLVLLPDGNFLVLDGARWRRMTPQGLVSTLPGTAPAVSGPSLVAIDANSLYAIQGHSVVKLTLDGTVTPLAGSADLAGYAEDTGSGARFSTPMDLVLSGGDLLVADFGNHLIRRLTPVSAQTAAWAGAAPQPGRVDASGAQARFASMRATVVDRSGNLYVIDSEGKTLRKVSPAGAVSTLFQDFPSDGGVAVDAAGNFYGARNRTIVKVSPSGAQSVLAGQAGVIGYADGMGTAALFATPLGLAIDAQGNLLVGDGPVFSSVPFAFTYTITYGNTLRKITPAGEVSTVAGTAGRILTDAPPNSPLDFYRPIVIASDAAGQVFVLDSGRNDIRRFAAAGSSFVPAAQVSGTGGSLMGLAVTPSGQVYFAQQNFSSQDGSTFFTLRKAAADGSSQLVAGQERADRFGVLLGPLPASLGAVSGLVAAGNETLYCCSENSVLKVQLS